MWIYDPEIRKQAEQMRAREMARLGRIIGRFVYSRLIQPTFAWYRRQRMFEELSHLDDRMLADIGLERHNIQAVCQAAYKGSNINFGRAAVTAKAANDRDQGTQPLAA